jgi:integrase
MAGTIREAKLSTLTARSRLKPGRQPHWNTLIAGRDHIGYQRQQNEKHGRWVLRRRRGGHYSIEPIGLADDDRSIAADGVSIFSHEQARAKAVELAGSEGRPSGKLTVKRAVADYCDYLRSRGKSTRFVESTAVHHILPALGNHHVDTLTSSQLRRWLIIIAERPPRLAPDHDKPIDDETIRRRRVSANRILAVLKACLNHAFDERRVASNDAWGRRVKKFTGVERSRSRYLTVAEAVQFLNACDPVFRPLARGALETGCRCGELTRLEVGDFDSAAGTILIQRSKSARSRHVILTPEGAEFFANICRGRPVNEIVFTRPDGQAWRETNHQLYVRRANERAKITPPITFHGLRHSFASLAIMNGMPLQVVAKALGHVNTKMVEAVYGHLSTDFVSQAIRAGAPRFTQSNVTPMPRHRSTR